MNIVSCKNINSKEQAFEEKSKENKELIKELEEIRKIDQIASDIARGEDKNLSEDQWKSKKDSLHKFNQKRIRELFNDYGFLGYDLVGKKGSQSFWLVVQHADNDPEFQNRVLEKMKIEVEKDNADPKNYGMLIDRVRINNGNKQLYGSQVQYNWKTCQAYPKKLEDSSNVNERRKAIGLKPLEIYLNELSELHYEINKDAFEQIGLDGPTLYKTK